jgi:putative nucleotidyltransferase with HDIG domain
MHTLPSLPAVYRELMRELQWTDASLKGVGRIVARDMGMTARVLQLVNSAFFGLRQQITDPVQAVIYLGLETIKALALSTQVFSQFDRTKLGHLPLQALQDHSLMVGVLAKRIAETERAGKQIVDYALAAGLLHDVGKLVLAVNHPQLYDEAMVLAEEQNIYPHEMEQQVFGASHAEVGAYLLGIWGLPNPIVEALAFHLHPGDHLAMEFTPLTAVHVANVLAHEASPCEALHHGTPIDADYLARLPGMAERLPVWRAISQEAIQEKPV